jgi:hypothetical protein
MQNNYTILDNAVGTIAEHTTALSDKAPLVHTHSKSDITDFPVYGTTAGTICEGNDSRLSDARTPTAHTHGKADVTDLFNSANTWTGSNTYAKTVTLYNSDNTQSVPVLYLRNSKAELSSLGNTSSYQDISFRDKNDTNYAYIRSGVQSNGSILNLKTFAKDSNNNSVENTIQIISFINGTKALLPVDSGTDLGNSNYKWKNLNGVNPGALSLPKIVAKTSADISSAIVGADGETQYLDGTDNNYTAALDGWISMSISGFTQSNELWITVYDQKNETWGTSAESSTSARNTLFIIFPIRANQKMRIRMKCTTVTYARFYPCEGNV